MGDFCFLKNTFSVFKFLNNKKEEIKNNNKFKIMFKKHKEADNGAIHG